MPLATALKSDLGFTFVTLKHGLISIFGAKVLLTAKLRAPTYKRIRLKDLLFLEPFILQTKVFLTPRCQNLLNLRIRDFWFLAIMIETFELLNLSTFDQTLKLRNGAFRAETVLAVELNRS